MGKKKNKNKVSGAVKTAAKTEKKLANKLKKELANLGEEDIAKVIADIEREEAKRSTASEKTLPGPPSPRAYASLTPHPFNNELILFGGEYHNGQKTEVYNELLFFNPEKGTWKQVKAPGAPPPRSAHQAVATSANKGELWVFGGEFTSPTETQFHHYKDLWCFSLAEKKWEKVVAPGGPSGRSGHRMAALGRRLVAFGGYCDEGRECRYFDDVHSFCLAARRWSRLAPAGRAPAPRSACVLLPHGNDALYIYGGFSRVREGRSERTHTHSDQFRLSLGAPGEAWRTRAPGPGAPPPRASQAAAVALGDKGYVFGGVADVEETEEDLRGEMNNELHVVELDTGRWRRLELRPRPRPPPPEPRPLELRPRPRPLEPRPRPPEPRPPAGASVASAPAALRETLISESEGFTLKLGGSASPSPDVPVADVPGEGPRGGPCPRMSSMMAIQRGTLYVYGGVLEKDEKQFYLGDMYSLDLNKLIEWKTIIPQPALPDWLGSDSECDSEGSSDDSSATSGDDDDE